MQFLASLPVRRVLQLIALISILPAIGVVIYTGLEKRRDSIKEAKQRTMQLAVSLANQQEKITAITKQLLITLAKVPEVEQLDIDACNRLFASLIHRQDIYVNIMLVDADGDLIASAIPSPPINVANRKHFQDVIKTHHFSVGEYIISRAALIPILPFGYPLLNDQEQIKAVVIAGLDLRCYEELAAKISLQKESMVGVMDHKGILMFRHPPPAELSRMGKPIRSRLWEHFSANPDGAVILDVGSDGVRRFYAFQPLRMHDGENPYLYMVVGIPEENVTGPAVSQLLHHVVLLLSVLVLAMLGAARVGETSVAVPLRRIASYLGQIAKGNLKARTEMVYTTNELGQVARTCDMMAESLERALGERRLAEDALRRSESTLRTIADALPVLMAYVDREQRYGFVNKQYESWFHIPCSEIVGKTVAELMGSAHYSRVKDKIEAVLAGELVAYDGDFLLPDGTLTFYEAKYIPDRKEDGGTVDGYFVLAQDISEARRKEDQIKASLREKELLLKEIHHRVKNNLQIISSLFTLQSDHIGARSIHEVFKDCENRIHSMSLIHETLYRSGDLGSINLSEYVARLVSYLLDCHGIGPSHIVSDIQIEDVFLDISQTIPCALILNELITNALKYAFPEGRGGRISIKCQSEEGKVFLMVQDDGVGLPPGFDLHECQSLGLRIVNVLVQQLDGACTLTSDSGTRFCLLF